MKKIATLAFVAAAFSMQAQAQQKSTAVRQKVHTGTAQPVETANRGTAVVSGLLTPASFSSSSPCFNNISVYSTSSGAYLAGNNSFGDKEFLMGYTLSNFSVGMPATLDTVAVLFALKVQGGNGNVRAKVYADNGSGAPGTLLGTSADKTVAQVDTTALTNFTFSSPVSITTNKFYVSVDVSSLYATADTVALFTTDGECATTELLAAYTKASDNNFYAYSDATNGWGDPFDISIFAKVTATQVGVNNVVKNTFEAKAFPIPAANVVTIAFVGQDNANTVLHLKDLTGKTVATASVATVKNGSYQVPFAVSNLSSGLYFVEIASGVNKGMLKVSVQ